MPDNKKRDDWEAGCRCALQGVSAHEGCWFGWALPSGVPSCIRKKVKNRSSRCHQEPEGQGNKAWRICPRMRSFSSGDFRNFRNFRERRVNVGSRHSSPPLRRCCCHCPRCCRYLVLVLCCLPLPVLPSDSAPRKT